MSFAWVFRTAAVGVVLVTSGVACDKRTREEVAKSDIGIAPEIAAEFEKQIEAYASLHNRLEATLPKLPTDATPQEIDRDQRLIEQLVVKERHDAKPGDIFVPGMQIYVRKLLADVFTGTLGTEERKAVHDELVPVRPAINKRYPDAVPLSTMPPRLLANLPKIPGELEYRFIGNDLILMDVHAHIILDFIEDAMPRVPPPSSKQ